MNKKRYMKFVKPLVFWVILILLVVGFFLIVEYVGNLQPTLNKNNAECIANNSFLYIQEGCGHCEHQLDEFGDFQEDLNIINCFYEREKCWNEEIQITATPSWLINGNLYRGKKSITELKELTNCK